MQGDLTSLPWSLRSYWWHYYRTIVHEYSDKVLLIRIARSNGHPVACFQLDVHPVYEDLSAWVQQWVMLMQRRKAERDQLESTQAALADEEFQHRWPGLWEHLTCSAFSSGEARKTSSLLLFEQGGKLKGMLKDKEEREVCFLTAPSILGLLGAFEQGIREGTLDWREDKEAPGPKGGGPKKRG